MPYLQPNEKRKNMQYRIILKPLANIAFEADYHRLCRLELRVVLEAQGVTLLNEAIHKYHKGHVLEFEIAEVLTEKALRSVYQCSFFYMLLENQSTNEREGSWTTSQIDYVPLFMDDLSTRLKYNGKTNESITRFMINIGKAYSDFQQEEQLCLLDPMCGKGTTLFEGLIDGYHVYGIEKEKDLVSDMGTYFSRYLKEGRFFHQMRKGKIVENKKNYGELLEFQVARTREALKDQEGMMFKCFVGDTLMAQKVYKKNMMHLVVVDLPYGIAHIGDKGQSKTRSLEALLDKAIDSWGETLKVGGCMVLAWNLFTDKRDALVALFEKKGYTCISFEKEDVLEHRVSQAIHRDIIVAKK